MDLDRASLRQQLIDDEGLVLHAYQDSLGYWTIGVGRLIDPRKGGGISEAEAIMLLDHDIDRVQAEVLSRWPWMAQLDPVRLNVVLNMAFNLGTAGLAKFKTTLGHIKAGRYDRAADAMSASLWATQVGRRAQRLVEVMRG
jgi:lysozyme